MHIAVYLVALFSCVIGKICGMGGGVIIKPMLDLIGIMSVPTINFLSGCTVLGMTSWSVGKSVYKKETDIDFSHTTFLGIGAALGGIIGSTIYSTIIGMFENVDFIGGIQGIVLFFATGATFFYTLKKDKVNHFKVTNKFICILIGTALGTLGAFLGIGGGPFNVAVLFLFFSMTTKVSAQNSLYIILISQAVNLLRTVVSGNVPEFVPIVLVGMVICGVAGSEIGSRINKKISEKTTTKLFEGSMLLVMIISIFNSLNYLGII